MFLTFLSTIAVFLFQVANATFQPSNRIDPNAADQQGTTTVTSWQTIAFWIGIGIVIGVIGLAIKNRNKAPKGMGGA